MEIDLVDRLVGTVGLENLPIQKQLEDTVYINPHREQGLFSL